MNKKYYCPRRPEKTPSAHAYGDHFFCFGCGARGPVSELGLEPGERLETTYVENIQATLDYIATLPTKEIRGFKLPFNDNGYFIVYPHSAFYKFRVEGIESGSKYRGPSGHSKPWFVANNVESSTLVLVEGEFNALSLASLEGSAAVISPGGAGDFYSRTGQRELEKLTKYETIHVVVDDDAAGAQAAIETKSRLITLGAQDVRLHLVKKDFNDVHVQEGKETLRRFTTSLGLL